MSLDLAEHILAEQAGTPDFAFLRWMGEVELEQYDRVAAPTNNEGRHKNERHRGLDRAYRSSQRRGFIVVGLGYSSDARNITSVMSEEPS